MTVVDRSASIRSTEIASTSIAWTTARATAANRSLGDEPSATSVATCLKAPCSPARRRSAARADASATATETSSAKPSTQASASARECSCGRAQRTPHVTPSTTTDDVSDDPNRLKPSRGQRLPFGNAESPTDASTVVRSSESSRNSHALASRTRATSDTTVSKTASRSACCAISRVTRRSAACCSCSPTTTLVGGATRPPSSTRPAADSNALRRVSSPRGSGVAGVHATLGGESRSREAPVTMTPIEAGRAHAAVGDGAGAARRHSPPRARCLHLDPYDPAGCRRRSGRGGARVDQERPAPLGIAFAAGRHPRLLAPRREGVEIALVEIRVDVCELADRLVERVA